MCYKPNKIRENCVTWLQEYFKSTRAHETQSDHKLYVIFYINILGVIIKYFADAYINKMTIYICMYDMNMQNNISIN